MSRFGWAYVNSEMTGAVANGPDKSIQFASGSSQKLSGSSNLTFDYTTNTLYLTGTLRADTLIVSASQILKSGSTIFGDSVGDTHQFTGSIFNTTLISGTVAQFTLITGSTVTGSTARFTNITGSTITATLITGSSLVVSASVISASTYLGITAGSTTPGGTNTNIQFNSGSTFSGSTNFTFDYNTNTVRLTGTLYADTLIVSSSTIFKSGSTRFGDDAADTHQFTGSVFTSNNLTVIGQVSASVALNTAGTIQADSNITSFGIISGSSFLSNGNITSNGIISSSGGLNTGGGIIASASITSTSGEISASVGIKTAGTITAGSIISSSAEIQSNSSITASNNIISTAGFVSASNGLYSGNGLTVTGSSILRSGLTVTGSSFVQALSSSGQIQATSLRGDGLNITGIEGSNVNGVGDDYSIQFKDVSTGTLTGSANLLYNTNNTLQISASAIVYPTSTKTGSFSIGPTDYFVFVSGTAVTGTFGASTTGRVIRIYNYGLDTVFLTASGISGFIGSGGTNVATIIQGTNPRTIELMYFTTNNRWLTISTGN